MNRNQTPRFPHGKTSSNVDDGQEQLPCAYGLIKASLSLIAGTVVCQEHDWPDSSGSSLYVRGTHPWGQLDRPTNRGMTGP